MSNLLLQGLRWLVWVGLLLIFVRGVATFIRPTGPTEPAPVQPVATAEPPGLRSFPTLFTIDYLTWAPNDSDAYLNRLKPYLTKGLDIRPEWKVEPARAQRVTGAWVHGVETVDDSHWRVTVAARVEIGAPVPAAPVPAAPQAQPSGQPASQVQPPAQPVPQAQPPAQPAPQVRVLYLSVPVAHADDSWIVYDFPALVPAPPRASAQEPMLSGKPVADNDDSVQRLLTGFFQAYMKGADVSYFLVPGVPAPRAMAGFDLDSVGDVAVVQSGADTWALAEIRLKDSLTGAVLTTRYTLQITRQNGRWYIHNFAQRGA